VCQRIAAKRHSAHFIARFIQTVVSVAALDITMQRWRDAAMSVNVLKQ
jgi:hypothetical protein